MRFTLVDRILELEKGKRVSAVKTVSLTEDYLVDHFPRFPVLPGVFMLEAMTQAGAWLIRVTDDFAHSMVMLKEARNVKYADFVVPGKTLHVSAEIKSRDEHTTTLAAQGSVDGDSRVSGRLVLHHYNLADTDPRDAAMDQHLRNDLRKMLELLWPEGVASQAAV